MIIVGTQLKMTRGDSECLIVSCNNVNGTPRPLVTGDVLVFTLRKTTVTLEKLISKTVSSFIDGKASVVINPADTAALAFGKYVYDLQLTLEDGTVKTIVKPSLFEVAEEVTYGD